MSWATPVEASSITNTSITQSELDAANAILELWVGVVADALDELQPRDLRLLKKAEAFQAAWMPSKPALLERSDVDNVIQDSLQFSKADHDTHVLAPLAKKAISQLSWRRGRTIEPLTPEQALLIRGKVLPETYGTYRYDTSDGIWKWEDI